MYLYLFLSYSLRFRYMKTWLILELHEIVRASHVVTCPIGFILLWDIGRHEEVLKLCTLVSFTYFLPFCSIYSWFCEGPGVDHTVLYKNCESMYYSCVPNAFYFALWLPSAEGSAQVYDACSIFNLFRRLGLFLQFFGSLRSGLY